MKKILAFVSLVVLVASNSLTAFAIYSLTNRSTNDPTINAYCGGTVAVSNLTMVMGCAGPGLNAVYTYNYSNSSGWALPETQKLTSGNSGDDFGRSADIDSDLMVVGAGTGNSNKGIAYVYKRTSGTWSLAQTLTASDGASGDNFGYSVSINGNFVIVGAYYHDVGGGLRGQAYIYKTSDSGSSWTQKAILKDLSGSTNAQFGKSVAILEGSVYPSMAVVGANNDSSGYASEGKVLVYSSSDSGTTWDFNQALNASDTYTDQAFGSSVAIYADYILVGAFGDQVNGASAGAAYVFKSANNTWTQQQKLTPSDPEASTQFGVSVALGNSGTTAIIGMMDSSSSPNLGAAYYFDRVGNSWTQTEKLVAITGPQTNYSGNGYYFGNAVDMDNNGTMVIGSYADGATGGVNNGGSIYAYYDSGILGGLGGQGGEGGGGAPEYSLVAYLIAISLGFGFFRNKLKMGDSLKQND